MLSVSRLEGLPQQIPLPPSSSSSRVSQKIDDFLLASKMTSERICREVLTAEQEEYLKVIEEKYRGKRRSDGI